MRCIGVELSPKNRGHYHKANEYIDANHGGHNKLYDSRINMHARAGKLMSKKRIATLHFICSFVFLICTLTAC